MTLLLASVTGPKEAETVIANGADLVDLKDPSHGALGALTVRAGSGIDGLSAVFMKVKGGRLDPLRG